MVVTTRSKSLPTLSLKTPKGGITKRTKVASSATARASKPKVITRNVSTTRVPAKAMAASYSQGGAPHAPASRPASSPASLTVLPHASALTSTTNDILEEGIAHLLKVEPGLASLIEKHECTLFSKESLAETVDPFYSLMSGIISQQISGAAARTIKARFISLFTKELEKERISFPTPAMVLSCDQETLRSGGLSGRKAEYAHSLAEKFTSGYLSADILSSASDEEVIRRLVEVRGIGAWSAEMFLIFGLKRMDVFSIGDLGIQRGQAVLAGRNVKAVGKGKWKYMTEADMIKYSEPFRPYRSLYMWYLWRASDVSVESLTTAKKASKAKKARNETE